MLQWFYNWKYGNAEMVKYWKTAEAARAKVTQAPEGHYHMIIEGEKYPFPGFPRGVLLVGGGSEVLDGGSAGYSVFTQTKHIIKNFVFNESWKILEEGKSIGERMKHEVMDKLVELAHANRYSMLPPERLAPPVKEIHRAFTKIARGSKRILALRDILTFILQEDDGYRFRVQWLAKFIPWLETMSIRVFAKALGFLEHAEVVGDMREKIVLLRRVLLEALKDSKILKRFNQLCSEIDWSKVKLTKADKYYFRAKYFRCDYPEYKY